MNFKNLYGLYFAIVAIMLFAIGNSMVAAVRGFMTGFEMGYESTRVVSCGDSLAQLPYKPLPLVWVGAGIHVKDKEKEITTVLSENANTGRIEMEPTICTVVASGNVGFSMNVMILSFLQNIMAFCVLGVSITMLIYLIKLFLRINTALKAREIFNMRIVRTLRILGILLFVQAFVSFIFMYLQGTVAAVLLDKYDVEIWRFEEIDYAQIIFGLATIMMSEIFKIGYKIQEEQNLTV